MVDLSERILASWGKRLTDLDDHELQREAQRRRAARAAGKGTPSEPAPRRAPPADTDPGSGGEPPRQVRQWYANLEIPVGSDLPTVETAYQRLVRRYDPERHRDDPERHRAALDLIRSLTRAYRGLARYLRPTPPR